MDLNFDSVEAKSSVFGNVKKHLSDLGFTITQYDDTRPWGGFYYIDETQSTDFISTFFPEVNLEDFAGFRKLSPKVLMVAPHARLSWQYHHRRSEIWIVIGGEVAIITSETDEQNEPIKLKMGDLVKLKQGERHRLIGLEGWGIVAEIWQHTDLQHPSDELDIVRVQDDFGR
jgi:mannose-6-phosphate isomerase-like protein (cupin superfamily)